MGYKLPCLTEVNHPPQIQDGGLKTGNAESFMTIIAVTVSRTLHLRA